MIGYAAPLFDVEIDRAESYVYVIGPIGSHVVKIGVSVDVKKRLGGMQTSNPFKLAVLWKTPGEYELESDLHSLFRPIKTYGEWFDFGEASPVACVAIAVDQLRGVATPSPDAVDPDADNPRYRPGASGCRWYTPIERILNRSVGACKCGGGIGCSIW